MVEVTLGQTNAGPRSGQLVISEIMYHPVNDPTNILEFVEIFNTSGVPVDLTNWRLDGAVEFTFPSGMQLDPTVSSWSFPSIQRIRYRPRRSSRFEAYADRRTSCPGRRLLQADNNAGDQLQLMRPDQSAGGRPALHPRHLGRRSHLRRRCAMVELGRRSRLGSGSNRSHGLGQRPATMDRHHSEPRAGQSRSHRSRQSLSDRTQQYE